MPAIKVNRNMNRTPAAFGSVVNLMEIMDKFNLSTKEFQALLRLLHYTQNGNRCIATQSQIMRDIGSSPNNSTRVFRKLKECCALIEKDGELFVNPHIFVKSDSDSVARVSAELVEYAAAEMEKRGLSPAFMTKDVKARSGAMRAAR